MRSTWIAGMLWLGIVPTMCGQALGLRPAAVGSDSRRLIAAGALWRRDIPHYGKWMTAAGVAALTIMGAAEHRQSKREWNQLLAICHSAQDACATGPDGRYLRSDAEQLYQLSRQYDRRANHWLLGAQASLLVTTALFIIDLHPGGPGNIPFSPLKLGVEPSGGRALVGVELKF